MPAAPRRTALDKDLEKISDAREASIFVARGLVAPGVALLFIASAAVFASYAVSGSPGAVIMIAAAAIGGYMAINIGANDVTNSVGPAVGSNMLSMGAALIMAAVLEICGALLAGWNVVTTVSSGIVPPSVIGNPQLFIELMFAALISAALWVNFSTLIGAPVSTTHSIVGAVMGSAMAAAGVSAVAWGTVTSIAFGWIISPLAGGAVAALFAVFIESGIVYQDDKLAAARRSIPILIALMMGSFAAYLSLITLSNRFSLGSGAVALIGIGVFLASWVVAHRYIRAQTFRLENRNQSLKLLFRVPLVLSAGALSFAHGANDVSNAVGPVAGIVYSMLDDSHAAGRVVVPLWVMVIGGFGISFGILLYGPKLIRVVGEQITRLNPMRAFCIALSTAIVVLTASWLGMPVSSTHIAVGSVFGVGFMREWYTAHSSQRRDYIKRQRAREQALRLEKGEPMPTKQAPAKSGKKNSEQEAIRRQLVRRAHVRTIFAAWFATVPAAGLFAALVFTVIHALT